MLLGPTLVSFVLLLLPVEVYTLSAALDATKLVVVDLAYVKVVSVSITFQSVDASRTLGIFCGLQNLLFDFFFFSSVDGRKFPWNTSKKNEIDRIDGGEGKEIGREGKNSPTKTLRSLSIFPPPNI